MTCPHLEETSALFDGRNVDRTHADSCDECRAFLADAAQLRESLVILSEAKDPLPRRRIAPILVPVALMLCLVLGFILGERRARLQPAPLGCTCHRGGRAEATPYVVNGGVGA